MGIVVTLKYLRQIGPGRWEYRRRVPESVKAITGQGEFKRVVQAHSDAALAREHAIVEAEFARMVADVKKAAPAAVHLTAREEWFAAQSRATELLAGVRGARDEDEARELLAENLPPSDTMTMKAVVNPEWGEPEPTLEDARKLYLKERLGGGGGERNKRGVVRLDRIFTRLKAALGDRANLALTELKRDDARKLRDHMLASDKKGGGKLSPASVQREIKIMSAVVTLGIREFDLANKAHNPFEKLEIKGSEEDAPSNGDIALRDPLPAAVIVAMRKKLKGDLLHIWRLLDGTGCRLAEITGLRTEDVVTGGDLPHIRVHWHTSRRLKTSASIREVPLVGDALSAAVEALALSKGAAVLFPRYARDGGPTATSAILMKHLRQITTDTRHTAHSLRHNMKDRLREAKAPKDVQDLVLGHSAKGAGERFYGSAGGKLGVAMRAMQEIVWD